MTRWPSPCGHAQARTDRLDSDLRAARSACATSYDRLRDGLVGYLDGIDPEDVSAERFAFVLDTFRDLVKTKLAVDGHGCGKIRRRDVERVLRDTAYITDKREWIDSATKLLAADQPPRGARLAATGWGLARSRFREQHVRQILNPAPAQAGQHRRAARGRSIAACLLLLEPQRRP